MLCGALLEVIVALAGVGTAVTLYPVVRRQNDSMALGFAAVRTVEAAMIFAGVVSLLSLVHLRENPGSADTASLVTTGASLVATLPVALWELSLGLWMTFTGFRPSPITAGMATPSTPSPSIQDQAIA